MPGGVAPRMSAQYAPDAITTLWMKEENIMTKEVIGTTGPIPLSPGLKTDNLIFISGQVPVDANGNTPDDVAEQTRMVLESLKSVVEAGGSSMDKVVKTTVFLTEVSDFAAMNAVYAEYFPTDPPTRSTIRCDLMLPGLKVEIEAIALR